MLARPKRHRTLILGPSLAVVSALLVLLTMASQAFAAGPPVNTTPPTIEPAPHIGRTVKATTGTWTNEGPGHWFACTKQTGGRFTSATCQTEGSTHAWESTALKEG